MSILEKDVDTLVRWIATRQRIYRFAGATWVASMVFTGGLVLMRDDCALTPVLPLSAAALWLLWQGLSTQWWEMRSRRAGHPVVRADLAWTSAAGRSLPPGWLDAPVPGELHRTGTCWTWRPSRWVTSDLPPRTWDAADVAAATLTPVWSPLVPACAQLRLYLHGGETVEALVRRPDRLLPA